MSVPYSHTFLNPVAFKLGRFNLRKKIAAFDYDSTLVGKAVKGGAGEWEWMYPSVPQKIRSYYNAGYCVIIFTNQQREAKLTQIRESLLQVGVPALVYVGFNFAHKKPRRIMFDAAVGGMDFDKRASFYCGDCMGREGDPNDADLRFAKNTGLIPKTPEEVFAA